MRKSTIGVLISLLGLALLAGCSAPKLGPPDTTGFLVVESTISTVGVGGGMGVVGGVSFSSSFPTFGELETPDGKIVKGTQYGGYILFTDLPPGRYKLVRISEMDPTYTISIGGAKDNLPENEAYSFNIAPGKPHYIGVIKFKKASVGSVTGTMSVTLQPNANDEKTAWKKLAESYAGTPWESRFNKRLNEMQDWGKFIGEVPTAGAIHDRFLSRAEMIRIVG